MKSIAHSLHFSGVRSGAQRDLVLYIHSWLWFDTETDGSVLLQCLNTFWCTSHAWWCTQLTGELVRIQILIQEGWGRAQGAACLTGVLTLQVGKAQS